jgi:toxin ParE1/3/4
MATRPSRYAVVLTAGAERDLEEIHDWIAEQDAPRKAHHVLDRLLAAAESLAIEPERGSHPRELLDLGIRDYRQTWFKPYRVVYRVLDRRVVIYLIADGRRDMQALLQRRLLRSGPAAE